MQRRAVASKEGMASGEDPTVLFVVVFVVVVFVVVVGAVLVGIVVVVVVAAVVGVSVAVVLNCAALNQKSRVDQIRCSRATRPRVPPLDGSD